MPDEVIKSLDDFRKFLQKYEEECGGEYAEKEIKQDEDGNHTYVSIARDESNYKETISFWWGEEKGFGWCGGWPESGDNVNRLLEYFKPKEERSFQIYLKATVLADDEGEAMKRLTALVENDENVRYISTHTDARTAQFN